MLVPYRVYIHTHMREWVIGFTIRIHFHDGSRANYIARTIKCGRGYKIFFNRFSEDWYNGVYKVMTPEKWEEMNYWDQYWADFEGERGWWSVGSPGYLQTFGNFQKHLRGEIENDEDIDMQPLLF